MSALIIGERYRKRLEAPLRRINAKVLWMPDNLNIDPRLAGHTDLSVIKLDENKIVVSPNVGESDIIVNYLTNSSFKIIPAETRQAPEYPHDAGLCACIIGNILIHNLRCTDTSVLANSNAEKIHVNQGYAKCSCCVVDDNALITSDNAIANAAEKLGISVLKISPGGIELEGFDYGFIGGASITLNDAVAFTGAISNDCDRIRIEEFIAGRGKSTIYLTGCQAFDIGGAVVI